MLAPVRALRAGDRLAAVTLSWGGPGTHPHRYDAGKRQLEQEFGVEVVEMPGTLAEPAAVATDPRARADDLHRAFADPDIAGVVATIGGDDSIRILRHLDLGLLAANPKPFVGYSDATITHLALRRAGMVSFYGPAIMAGFAENGGLHRYLVDGVRRMLFTPAAGPVDWPVNHDGWTVRSSTGVSRPPSSQPRALHASTGWRFDGDATAEGPTVAACVEVLDWLRGSEWWPELDGAVLLLETSEDAPPPGYLTYFLRTLAATGQLQGLAALVLGRPGGADLPLDRHAEYEAAVLRVVRTEERLMLPVVTGVDFGHTDPMWTIPQGVPLRVDPVGRRLTFLDTGVR